ncbi:MAG: histidine phosphatase family protein [Microthrixaceae bacterium]|nr:histidine phosphatase family protein [Microthrixaceae bacterium]
MPTPTTPGGTSIPRASTRQSASRHLGTEPIQAIYSSPLPRCVETVSPLAESLGIEVILEARLGEGIPVESAWSLLEEVCTDTVVLCSHGDVIPELVARNQRRGMRTCEPSGFSKGSVWTLRGWDGTRFTTGSWTRPR